MRGEAGGGNVAGGEDLGTSGSRGDTDRQPPQQGLSLDERLNIKVGQTQRELQSGCSSRCVGAGWVQGCWGN